jgi:hypothetical protein
MGCLEVNVTFHRPPLSLNVWPFQNVRHDRQKLSEGLQEIGDWAMNHHSAYYGLFKKKREIHVHGMVL